MVSFPLLTRSYNLTKFVSIFRTSPFHTNSTALFFPGKSHDDLLHQLAKRPDYFSVYKLKPSLKIDLKYLQKELHNLQAVLHPDRHVQKPLNEQQIVSDVSSFVNEAYQILSDPYERAKYVIRMRLGLVDLDDELLHTQMDSDFLEDMMNIRERVESIQNESEQDRSQLIADLQRRSDKTLVQLDSMLQSEHPSQSAESNLSKALGKHLGKLKFYQNALKRLKNNL